MLYIVATPIGNLQDISFRAIETLKSVERIYCEDIRQTVKLLNHYDIKKPLVSLHQHTRDEKLLGIVLDLKSSDGAFVSDAGTPTISDPGGRLVEMCQENEVDVCPIPGASAVTTLLSAAGVRADSFWFAGFLPTKKGRQTLMKKIIAFDETVVVFETSPRLIRFFTEMMALGCTKKIIIGRELTKQFEEIKVGTCQELKDYYTTNPPRGEIVIAIS